MSHYVPQLSHMLRRYKLIKYFTTRKEKLRSHG
jgi:hypothetical protein